MCALWNINNFVSSDTNQDISSNRKRLFTSKEACRRIPMSKSKRIQRLRLAMTNAQLNALSNILYLVVLCKYGWKMTFPHQSSSSFNKNARHFKMFTCKFIICFKLFFLSCFFFLISFNSISYFYFDVCRKIPDGRYIDVLKPHTFSSFRPYEETVFIVHGFNGTARDKHMRYLKDGNFLFFHKFNAQFSIFVGLFFVFSIFHSISI